NIRGGRSRAAFDPILAALPNVAVLAVLVLGVQRVTSGSTDAGDVVTIAYLLTVVSFPIRSIGWLLGDFPRSVVGYHRVASVLAATGNTAYGDQSVPERAGGAQLVVDEVAFAYESQRPLLREISFEVEPGQRVALVGATASGKSTLTALLSRLFDPQAGAVRIDGTDLRDLRHGALAQVTAVVQQSDFLFDDTVRGNIALGSAIRDEDVWSALRTAQADGFVAALPHGIETRLGERGTSLSGGQRQRIALARALARRPRLLVLDDATSAVDPEVESRILAGIGSDSSTSAETTLVVVAYRKATIGLADEVLFLSQGRIVDRGPHDRLVRTNPDYARLVNAYESDRPAEADGDPAQVLR
ncbi:MAG: ABC transporter ATP-binding protein/permease, partial [Nocardioidaceae bacterium]|nr:ABC transporter ATP-binding protein/permease [Nocardioidaceae bacterium]